jgi:hypothetical protein
MRPTARTNPYLQVGWIIVGIGAIIFGIIVRDPRLYVPGTIVAVGFAGLFLKSR